MKINKKRPGLAHFFKKKRTMVKGLWVETFEIVNIQCIFFILICYEILVMHEKTKMAH